MKQTVMGSLLSALRLGDLTVTRIAARKVPAWHRVLPTT